MVHQLFSDRETALKEASTLRGRLIQLEKNEQILQD